MAHFARIEDGIVKEVIVISNEDCNGGEFPESESYGQEFISGIGLVGNWLQTSYNNNFRKQFAGILYTYDEDYDIFIDPQPYPSWTLDEDHEWQAPTEKPEGDYVWNETDLEWIEVV